MARKDSNPGKKEEIAERRRRVWELRKSGVYSIRAILAKLTDEGIDASLGTIHKDLQVELTKLQKETVDFCEEYRALTNARCEDIISGSYDMATKGDEPSVRNVARMIDLQIKIGVVPEAPKQINVNSREALAGMLGISEEDLPDQLS